VKGIEMKLDLLYALEILFQVQKKHPEAIIAGGFLRDLYFGKKFKDIDIFVANPIGYISDSFIRDTSYDMTYSTDSEISEVQKLWYDISSMEGLGFDAFEVNIICVPSGNLVDRVQEHDFDFCQVHTDGKQIYGAEILQQVQQTKQITLVQCENQKQLKRSLRRWDRFQEKYPGFTLKYKEGIYNG
jgi:hypothetical protein